MTELEKFYELKEKVLLKYQEYYPFFTGNWKVFSSQDIQNLIGLLEEHCKQTISEKWIYTHLKPETNNKIPRKDMLNILSEFVGFSGWDEFVFEEKSEVKIETKKQKKSKLGLFLVVLSVIVIAVGTVFFQKNDVPETKTIELNNQFTNEKIESDEVKVFQVDDTLKKELEVKDGEVKIVNSSKRKTKLVIQSPFYQPKTIVLHQNGNTNEPPKTISLEPDDYAMMLKAFMLSDIKDWQTRKVQLNKILADNLEVIVMLKDNLGSEYFNKTEFSQKLIVPTTSIRKMKIIEIKNDANNKIQFIRIKQE